MDHNRSPWGKTAQLVSLRMEDEKIRHSERQWNIGLLGAVWDLFPLEFTPINIRSNLDFSPLYCYRCTALWCEKMHIAHASLSSSVSVINSWKSFKQHNFYLRKRIKASQWQLSQICLVRCHLPTPVPFVVLEAHLNSLYLQIAVILMLFVLWKEQLFHGQQQQLMVRQINNKLDWDAAAVKLALLQICSQMRRINWRKTEQLRVHTSSHSQIPVWTM